MRLSSIITIKEVLEEQIENTKKQIDKYDEMLNHNMQAEKRNYDYERSLVLKIKSLARYRDKLDKALIDLEHVDWH